MSLRLDRLSVKNPRILLLYPPLQFASEEVAKPDGSLGLAYLAGALRDAGYHVKILDCAVGEEDQALEETFFRVSSLESGLLRVGMKRESIIKIAEKYDVIGVSAIFTAQTTMSLELISSIRAAMPEKLIIAGGINARNLRHRFYRAGVDIIALSEAEATIVRIAKAVEGNGRLTETPGIAFMDDEGHKEVLNKTSAVCRNLDVLPMPAWDLLPLRQFPRL